MSMQRIVDHVSVTLIEPEPAPEVTLLPDDTELSDDPLQAYLREIHTVRLLTAKDERHLASCIEDFTYLDRCAEELSVSLGCKPSSLDVTEHLLQRLHHLTDIVQALSDSIEIDDCGELLLSPQVRGMIDSVLNRDLVGRVCDQSGVDAQCVADVQSVEKR